MKPIDFVPRTHPPNVRVSDFPEGKELGAMLESGEIDALISADNPKCILENSPLAGRLFPDYPTVEREYYKRTGIFPITHTVVIRKEVLESNRGLARTLYDSFQAAEEGAMKGYEHLHIFNNMDTMLPWFSHLLEEDRTLLGGDWWPYGIAANRKTLDTLLRYHYEQGITEQLYSIRDLFAADMLNTQFLKMCSLALRSEIEQPLTSFATRGLVNRHVSRALVQRLPRAHNLRNNEVLFECNDLQPGAPLSSLLS